MIGRDAIYRVSIFKMFAMGDAINRVSTNQMKIEIPIPFIGMGIFCVSVEL